MVTLSLFFQGTDYPQLTLKSKGIKSALSLVLPGPYTINTGPETPHLIILVDWVQILFSYLFGLFGGELKYILSVLNQNLKAETKAKKERPKQQCWIQDQTYTKLNASDLLVKSWSHGVEPFTLRF